MKKVYSWTVYCPS